MIGKDLNTGKYSPLHGLPTKDYGFSLKLFFLVLSICYKINIHRILHPEVAKYRLCQKQLISVNVWQKGANKPPYLGKDSPMKCSCSARNFSSRSAPVTSVTSCRYTLNNTTIITPLNCQFKGVGFLFTVNLTRRYSPLRGLTFNSCGGLRQMLFCPKKSIIKFRKKKKYLKNPQKI